MACPWLAVSDVETAVLELRCCLDRVGAGFAGADADGFLDIEDENLAVADAARARSLLDRLDGALDQRSSGTTISIFTLGRKSTTYSAPR